MKPGLRAMVVPAILSCVASLAPAAGPLQALKFRVLDQSERYLTDDSKTAKGAQSQVLASRGTLVDFWGRWFITKPVEGGPIPMPKALPQVDFRKETVVFVATPAHNTPDVIVQVMDVVRGPAGVVTVRCQRKRPAKATTSDVPLRACAFVAIPKTPADKVKIWLQDPGFRALESGRHFITPTVQEARHIVIDTQEQYRRRWVRWQSAGRDPAPSLDEKEHEARRRALLERLPAVDFTRETAVFVIAQPHQLPSHRIEVVGVAKDADGIVTVRCYEHAGTLVGAAMQAFRHYQIVAIPRADKEKVKIVVHQVAAPPLPPGAPLPPSAPPAGPGDRELRTPTNDR